MSDRSGHVWRLTGHVCAVCLGRVVERLVVEPRPRRRPKPEAPANGELAGIEAPMVEPAPAPRRQPERPVMTRHEFRCADCALSWVGGPAAGCACGIKLGGRNAGIRCTPNPKPCPEMPSEFIAKEAE